MGGLGLRMVGGALAGIGDGILADAKAKKETMLLQLEHQLRAGDQQAHFAHEDQTAATAFSNQKTLEQMKLDAGDEDIQSVVTDNTGSLVGVTKRGAAKPLGIQSGKPTDEIKDKFQDDRGNWYGVTQAGKTIDLKIRGKLPQNAADRPTVVHPGDKLLDNSGKVIYGDEGVAGGLGDQTHGDEYLKTLDSKTGGIVKALSEGRMAFPTGAAIRSPYWQSMIDSVGQYDPSFDATNYPTRAKTRASFAGGGKDAATVAAMEQALGHAGTLYDQIGGTAGHSGFPFATSVNAAQNYISSSMGNPGVPLFKDTAGKLASELTTVFRGGTGAEADVIRNLQSLNEDDSTETKKALLRNAVELLNARLLATADKYNSAMGTSKEPMEFLKPHAADAIRKIGGVVVPAVGYQTGGAPTSQTQGAAPAAPQPAAAPSPSQAQAPAAPTRATIPAPQNLLSEPDGTIVEDDQHRRYEKRGSQLIPR